MQRSHKSMTLSECWDYYLGSLEEVKPKHVEITRMVRKYSDNHLWDDTSWFLELKQTYKASTWNPRKTWLKTCIDYCLSEGVITGRNLYALLKNSSNGAEEDAIKPFSKAEISKILEALESNAYCRKGSIYPHHHYVPFVSFLFLTGVRTGEAVALQWSDINWDKKIITISKTYSRTSNSNVRRLKATKTGVIRHIPLNDELENVLTAATNPSRYVKGNFVFNGFRSKAIDPDNFRERIWKPVLEALGIEYRYPYQSRHTVLSEVASKQGLLAAAKLAGHKNTEMVSRHYARYTDEIQLPSLNDE